MDYKPRILVLSPSNLATDPRVRRQLIALQDVSRITAAGFGDPQMSRVEFISIADSVRPGRARRLSQLLTRRYASYYHELPWVKATRAALARREFDLVIANDAESWPIALELRGAGQVLLDAHEYAPREFEHAWWWRLFYSRYKFHLCRHYLARGDGALTVCAGIADEYSRVFGVRPVVVMNVPPAVPLTPSPVAADRVRMIHHGAAIPGRNLEEMVRVAALLDERFTLDFMLVPSDQAYLTRLRRFAAKQTRVRFLEPVPGSEIPRTINRYDLGLYLLAPNSFNNLHALPNKFFEFIQARLGVAIGPSPEMARIVRAHSCGVVADEFRPESLAASLREIAPDRLGKLKQAADRAAGTLCWERERELFLAEVERLLAARRCAA